MDLLRVEASRGKVSAVLGTLSTGELGLDVSTSSQVLFSRSGEALVDAGLGGFEMPKHVVGNGDPCWYEEEDGG